MPSGGDRPPAPAGDDIVLRVGPASRELRRTLRPIEWVVLEDVVLVARRDGAGRLVAPTSARQVAEHLSLTPGVVARALARLRREGLLTYAREAGPAGRFGLSTYVVGTVPGLEVVEPTDALPGPPPPCPAGTHLDGPRAVKAHTVAAPPLRPVGANPARPSLHDDVAAALAAAVDDAAAEERAGSTGGRAANKRGRRPASKPAATQLSILDTARDSTLENPTRHP